MISDFQIATGLAKLGIFLRSESRKKSEPEALTPTQAQILVHILRRGPTRVGPLAQELAVTQPTVSDAVAALARKRHLEKRADPLDGRAALLHITGKGRRAAEVLAEWPDALLSAIGTLDMEERGVFLEALTRMIRDLQRRGAIPVQRMCATCQFFRPNVHDDPTAPHHCAFVDAAFGNADLRLDCGEHEAASDAQASAAWRAFAGGGADEADAPPAAPNPTTGGAS